MNFNENNFLPYQIEANKNIIKLIFSKSQSKYNIEIFLSKNKEKIIFRAENIGINSFYFYNKYSINILNMKINNNETYSNSDEFFDDLKNIFQKNRINLEENKDKMNLIFDNNINLILKKKYFCQNKINSDLVNKLNNQTKKINIIESQMNHFDEAVTKQNEVINNINNKIDNNNTNIKNIIEDFNNINNNLKNYLTTRNEKNETLPQSTKSKKEKINKYIENKRCFFFNSKFLFFLNIFFFIIVYNLYFFLDSMKEKIEISSKQREKLFTKYSYFESLFKLFENFSDEEENEFNSQKKFENIKSTQNKLNEFLNSIKEYDINMTFINDNISNFNISNNIDEINETKQYMKKQIMKIKNNNNISDVNFILKYTKEYSKLDFYINCQNILDNLIYIQNKNGSILYIYSTDIIRLMTEFALYEKININNNGIIYIFQQVNNYVKAKSKEEFLIYYIKNILDFVNNNENYKGEILNLKIYEIKYESF